jgi:hypothetical protein
MRVDHVTLNSGESFGYQKPKHAGQTDQGGNNTATAPLRGDDVSQASAGKHSTVEQPDNGLDGPENAKGVIGLLQEGHFKGVADIRLRINFFDKIASIEHASLRAVADDNVNGLLQAAKTGFAPMIESGQLTQEQADGLLATFEQTTGQLIEDFLAGRISSSDALIEELRSGFDNLLATLSATSTEDADQDSGAVNQVAEETIAPETAPDQTDNSEETDLQTPVDELVDAFKTALEALANALNDVRVLPELSPPQGNGVAYQKFLEIYNQLRGVGASDTPADAELVDAVT